MSSEPEQPSGEYAPSRQARRFRTTGVTRASKRRMSAGRKAWYLCLVALARAFLWLIWTSCRVTVVKGAEHLEPARRAGSPAVVVYWHQMHLFCAWLLVRQARAGLRVAVLTSPSVSGEVPAAIITRWGMQAVRGSSTRSAGDALREMHRVLARDGNSLVITADGPKGPRHEFKPGAMLLAQMSKAPVIPMAYAASRCSRARTWDQFIVPWPFSRIAVVVGEPWVAPPGFTMTDLSGAARDMEERLKALGAEAGRLVG